MGQFEPTAVAVSLVTVALLAGCTHTSGKASDRSGLASPSTSVAPTPTPRDTGTEISQPPIPPARTIKPTPAGRDVTLGPVAQTEPGLLRTVATILNHSSQVSDYQITVRFTTADHKQILGPGSAFAHRVGPGKKATVEILLLAQAKGPYAVSLTSASRYPI